MDDLIASQQSSSIGTILIALLVVVVVVVAAGGYYFYSSAKRTRSTAATTQALSPPDNTVSPADLLHLARTLSSVVAQSNSNDKDRHWHVIVAILSAPSNRQWATYDQQRVQQALIKRQAVLDAETKKNTTETAFDDLVNGGGWAEDDEEDDDDQDRVAKAKAADVAEQQRMERLKQATGQTASPMEALDEGVLGQTWVEQRLQEHGVWPPDTKGVLGVDDTVWEDAGMRKLLCIATGRWNSQFLNQHPELLQAGAAKRLDQTYFSAAAELRMRVNMFLEAAMRVAVQLQCFPLSKTIAETMRKFKIGIREETADTQQWFDTIMMKTYGVKPKLEILSHSVTTNDEGKPTLELECERLHAKHFLEQKLEQCKQQNIPPQLGLQTFREPWWLFLQGPTPEPATDLGPLQDLTASDLQPFRPPTLVKGFPVVVTTVAQAKLKLTLLVANAKEGDEYTLHIISSEFLGSDHELSFTVGPLEPKKDK